jgi:hypothetical protein
VNTRWSCPREQEVLAAARRGELASAQALGAAGELARHAASCAPCAASLAVDAELRRTAADFAIAARLPDPGALLLHRREAERRHAAERALRPLRLASWAAGAVAAGTAVSLGGPLLVALAPALRQSVSELRAPALPALPALAELRWEGAPAWASLGVLLLSLLVIALRLAWEDA